MIASKCGNCGHGISLHFYGKCYKCEKDCTKEWEKRYEASRKALFTSNGN